MNKQQELRCQKHSLRTGEQCERFYSHEGNCRGLSELAVAPLVISRYEHKIIELRLYATEAELNVLGDEGWQLVSESIHEDQVRYVFCRVKQP